GQDLCRIEGLLLRSGPIRQMGPTANSARTRMDLDYKTLGLVGGVLGLLLVATLVNQWLRRQGPDIGLNPAVLQTFNSRIRAWWLMCTVLAAAFLLGPASEVTTVVLFGLISFWALREF